MDGIIDQIDMGLSKLWEIEKDRKHGVLQFIELQRLGHRLRD